jgi:hypothetical protein
VPAVKGNACGSSFSAGLLDQGIGLPLVVVCLFIIIITPSGLVLSGVQAGATMSCLLHIVHDKHAVLDDQHR